MDKLKNLKYIVLIAIFFSFYSCNNDNNVLDPKQNAPEGIQSKAGGGFFAPVSDILVTYNFPPNATQAEKDVFINNIANKMNTLFFSIYYITQPNNDCDDNIEKWRVNGAEYAQHHVTANLFLLTTGGVNDGGDDDEGCMPPCTSGIIDTCFTDNFPAIYFDIE